MLPDAFSIMYHDVVEPGMYESSGFPGADAHVYKLERNEFRAHLRAVWRAAEAVETLRAGRDWPGRPVFLTFDDGGESAYGCTAGMLEEFGWRGHFFVTTARIGARGFMNKVQIRELRRRGHVVGSHSHTHPTRMAALARKEVAREWKTSVDRLSDMLGEPAPVASLPGGYYSRRVAEEAARAGIQALFTSEPTQRTHMVDGCLVLGRYYVRRGMPPEWSGAFAGNGSGPRHRQAILWGLKKAAKMMGGSAYLQVREMLLR